MEELELTDVIENGVVERGAEGTTVYLLGGKDERPPVGAPKVIGLDAGGKDDFTLKEEAYMRFMNRMEPEDGIMIVREL